MVKKAFLYGFCIILLISCSNKATHTSFIAKLDEADSFILYSQFTNAEKALKTAEKMAQSDLHYIAIYKRLYKMKKMDSCERLIKKMYKKYGYKTEIQALYTHFLLETRNYTKALQVSKDLQGTKYGSLYAESLFSLTEKERDFFSAEYIKAYIDAYSTTGNPSYSLNAASLLAGLGRFRDAMSYHPEQITSYDPLYFWALIAYDAGDFDTSIYDLSLANFSKEKVLLEADAYLKAGLLDEASEIWLSVIENNLDSPISYLNAAHISEEKEDFSTASRWLLEMVNRYPDFTPGLVEYGYYALRLEKQKPQDILTSDLELKGIKTLDNARFDNFIQIPLSDALWRIDTSLENKEDIVLELEKIKLNWAYNIQKSRAEKNSEVYALLEKFYLGNSLYEERVLQWALWYFLSQRQWKEAEDLFIPYLTTKYGEHAKDAKDEVYIVFDAYNSFSNMRSWEREFLAYFEAVYKNNLNLAFVLFGYEFENGEDHLDSLFQRDRVPLMMNLANMYFGLKQTEKAIELYSIASSQSLSESLKSDIHYRLALISLHKQEIKNALLNAEFSILLNPNNTEARLLYKKLKD